MSRKATLKQSLKVKSGKNGSKKSKSRSDTKSATAFLDDAPTAIRTQFAGTVDLPTFRETTGQLSKADRLTLIEQALVLLDQNYVHLPLKEAMHGVDPVQRLRLLQDRTKNTAERQLPDEQIFHREMISIFMSVRDLHTNYMLPRPYNNMTAFVPFQIEDYFEGGERRFIVSNVFRGFEEPPFERGVEVLRWNGIPIDRAVEINGNRFAGSNEDARRARGIETMTIRALITSLPPDEERVVLDYRTSDGQTHELRVPWLVFSPDTGDADAAVMPAEIAAAQGVDIELEMCGRARKMLFAPSVVAAERKAARAVDSPSRNLGLTSTMPGVLEAKAVDTPAGTFGYLRIRTFSVNDADSFVSEVVRLIRQLPDEGLIIDVRDNGGGLIMAGEQLVQLLTPGEIQPEPTQFINTSLNLKLCERLPFLSQWTNSIRESIRTGATFSRGFPITPQAAANNVGQQYHGPVVLITDALCYSTTDIFAAGFQDQVKNGVILGVDGNTGAGGANVWTHGLLSDFLPAGEPGSPYRPLPDGSGLRVSIRRTMRVGENAGTPVEDLGVVPDLRHDMTQDDVLNGNVDLINHAGEILADMPVRVLRAEISMEDDAMSATVTTRGFSRMDVYADGRPLGSTGVTDGETELGLGISNADVILFRGFEAGILVAELRVDV